MSAIKSQIVEKTKEAMKSGNKDLVVVLRGLSAAIKQFEVDTRTEATDGDIATIFQKELKKLRDAKSYAEQQQRSELVEKAEREIEIVQAFIGKELSDDELRNEIQRLVSSGADAIGKVMAGLNAAHKGRFDGKRASELAKEILS